jgi:hypothetical protein
LLDDPSRVTSGWMVGGTLALLAMATANAWGLLLQVGTPSQAGPAA